MALLEQYHCVALCCSSYRAMEGTECSLDGMKDELEKTIRCVSSSVTCCFCNRTDPISLFILFFVVAVLVGPIFFKNDGAPSFQIRSR